MPIMLLLELAQELEAFLLDLKLKSQVWKNILEHNVNFLR
jgi:hypothetical protein